MNIFLTSIMHPETANDINLVTKNFELTARSVCGQTNLDFLFVVVCNEKPKIHFRHKNIKYHIVNFPPAKSSDDYTSKRLDKGSKLISGLLNIKKYDPDYVYIIDADDWVSKDLNEFLNRNKVLPLGWYISAGYIVDLYRNKKQFKFGLNRFCGSTFITNYDVLISCLGLDSKLSDCSKKSDILSLVNRDILLDLFASHGYIEYFLNFNMKYKPILLPSLVWVRNTGENILSDGSIDEGMPIDKKLLDKFSISNNVEISNKNTSVSDLFTYYLSTCISFLGWLTSKNKDMFQ